MSYKLYHFSEQPFIFNRHHIYKPHPLRLKPAGLWLSVNDDWAKWCRNNNFCISALKYRTEFTIDDTSKICYLRTASDIDSFIDEYNYTYLPNNCLYPSIEIYTIYWSAVQHDYNGIFIDTENEELYSCGFRSGGLDTWLDSWDCLSGCIWNFDIVHQVNDSEKITID